MQRHIFYQILSSVTACLLLFHVGVWVGYLSVTIPRFKTGKTPITMTSDNISWMVAFCDIGNLICAFPAGYLMDRLGRLFTLRLAFSTFLLAVGLTLVATTPYHMYLASLLVGVGTCIGFSTSAIYVAEIAEPKIRGSLGSIGGVLFLGGTAITMSFGPYLSFEALTWASLVCPLIGLVLTFAVVESPYYYFIHNRKDCAARALAQVRSTTKTNEKAVELASIRKRVEDDLKDPTSFWDLISQKSNRKAFTIVLILWITRAAGGNTGVSIYAPTSLPENWDPKVTMAIFSWLNVIFSLLGMGLVDRLGCKPLLLISLLGLGLVTAVSAVFYYFHQKTDVDVTRFAFVPHAGVLLFGVFFPIGIGLMSQIYRGELLSVRIKGPVSAIVQVVVSVCLFVGNKAYFAVSENVGVYLMYTVFSIVNFVGLIFSIACVFETKGKTLEEIQSRLNT